MEKEKNILILENEKLTESLLIEYLKNLNCSCLLMNSEEEVLKYLNQHSVDLLLLDISLTKMDAYQLCERMKNDRSIRDIPIIFIGSSNQSKDISRAFEVGGADYIKKPFAKEMVKSRVETQLQLYDAKKELKKNNEEQKFVDKNILKRIRQEQDILLNNIKTKIWYLKDYDRYGKVNQAYADFLGVPKEEIENSKMNKFFPNHKAVIYEKRNQKVFNLKEKIKTEKWLKNAQNEKRLLSITKTPQINELGEVEFVVCFAEDITEKQKKENILREVEIKYEKLFTNMPAAFAHHKIIYDDENNPIDYKFLKVNKSFEKMTGLKRKEIIGKKAAQVLEELSREKWLDKYSQVALTGESINFEEYSAPLDKWYKVNAYSPEKGYFTTLFYDISDRKNKEKQLRQNKEKFNNLLNNTSDVIWSLSWPDLKVEFISSTAEDIYGYTSKEFKDDPELWKNIAHPDDRHLNEKALKEIKEKCRSTKESRIITKDGNIKWIQDKSKMIYDENNNPIIIEGSARDITERKQAEKELKKSEARFQRMLSVIPDMVSIHDPEMNILYSNWNGFASVPEEKRVLNTKCYKTYRGYNNICPSCKAKNVLKTKKPFLDEVKLDDGTWIDLKVMPILDDNNNIEFFVEWVRDISERKKREQELTNQKKLLEGVMNNISDIIAIQHPDHKIMKYNQAGYDLLDLNPQEVKGQKCYELIGKEKECKECATRKALKSGKMEQLEKYEPALDIFLDCRSNPILDDQGNIKWIIEQLRDITERKKQEQKIKNQKERLKWIIDGIDAGTWEWNIQTGKTTCNEKFAEQLGYELEELKPTTIKTWESLVHPDDLKKHKTALKKHLQGEIDCYSVETRMKHNDGRLVWILSRGKVISWTDDGRPHMMFGMDINISKEKRNEQIIKKLHKATIEFQTLDNEQDICQKTIDTAKEILNFDLSHISLVKDNKFIPTAVSEEMDAEIIPLDYGIAGKAFKNNQSYLTMNSEKDSEAKPTKKIYRSAITVPLTDIGVFQAISTKKNDFIQKDLELAETLIGSAKAALIKLYFQKDLKYKSFHDNLTTLYNRRYFDNELVRVDTTRQLPLSIIVADINGLKIINDSLGHKKGDQLLIKSAVILKEVIREEDIIARYGGDEFAILLPQTSQSETEKIIARIKEKARATENEELAVSIALGSAVKTEIEQDINNILKEADNNMYQNKLSESRSTKSKIVKSLLNSLEVKSDETKEHTLRMTKLAFEFGEKLNLSNSELNRLSLLSTLHDIGKITIEEDILSKPGDLTDAEWKIMKSHAERGYKIANSSEEFAVIAEEIYAHHERWDGRGYPRGLKGK